MTPEISERQFEDDIERGLLVGGADARDGLAEVRSVRCIWIKAVNRRF